MDDRDDRDAGRAQSDALFARLIAGWVRVVLDRDMGYVKAGTVVWVRPLDAKNPE